MVTFRLLLLAVLTAAAAPLVHGASTPDARQTVPTHTRSVW